MSSLETIADVTAPVPTTALAARIHELWSVLGAPATGRRVPGTVPVGVAGALAAVLASAWLVPSGWSLAYSDAQSHLTIARRIFDTLSEPGLGQLGTVWLPIPHLLLMPFTLPLWAWHTGWAGAFLGAACLGVTAAGCYRVAARWGYGRPARLTVVAALVTNPTLLYLTSTALTEPVLIAAMAATLAALAFFTSRTRLSSAGELAVFAGLPAAAAVLSRYEGWAITVTGAIYVALVTWRRTGVTSVRHPLGPSASRCPRFSRPVGGSPTTGWCSTTRWSSSPASTPPTRSRRGWSLRATRPRAIWPARSPPSARR